MQIYHFSRECVSAWNRAAGVQFLRLGLSLFEQEVSNFKFNKLFFNKMPLINNTYFITEPQRQSIRNIECIHNRIPKLLVNAITTPPILHKFINLHLRQRKFFLL